MPDCLFDFGSRLGFGCFPFRCFRFQIYGSLGLDLCRVLELGLAYGLQVLLKYLRDSMCLGTKI